MRGSKTVNGAKSTYQYIDGTLLYEDRNGTYLYYYYDSYGTIAAISAYLPSGASGHVFVGTNSLGDVNALYNANGEMIVKYEYDAWGKVLAETDANGNALTGVAATWNELNPFRYRGYYYDSETGLYYLQSRYYDSEVGRFLNSDAIVNTTDSLGFNTYTYCGNNPVNYVDPMGFCYRLPDGRWISCTTGNYVDDYTSPPVSTNEKALWSSDYSKINLDDYDDDSYYDNNDRLRSRDAKRREKSQIDNALGKRSDSEQQRRDLHKGKRQSGKNNDDNFSNKDLVDQNFYLSRNFVRRAAVALLCYMVLNDSTGIGMLDNVAIPIIIESIRKVGAYQ